jgi:hypothetical protein
VAHAIPLPVGLGEGSTKKSLGLRTIFSGIVVVFNNLD